MPLSAPAADTTPAVRDHGFHHLRIARVVRETAEASTFVLDVPDALRTAFAYRAGQFCTFRVTVDGQPHLRCYSMSSSPDVDAALAVTVKRVTDGVVSNWMLDHLAPGDDVEVTRPAGVFTLGEGVADVVAFAAGSGITPVFSLLKTALATTGRRLHLVYANRDPEAAIFGAEIDALASRPDERCSVSHRFDVDHGFLGPDDVRPLADVAGPTEYYICGPGPFMDVVEQTLLSRGVDADRLHIERFTPADEPAPAAAPAAADDAVVTTSRVTIELDGRSLSTDHRSGTTILQTARQLGMSPPFSCEAGSCATCMARLVEGTASMLVNNALTDDEVAEGWVLTCQAVPTSPVVQVSYTYEDA